MSAHDVTEPRRSGVGGILAWLGGGHWGELGERHERSSHAVAGAVVLLGAVLAWLVAAAAVSEATRWSPFAVVPATLVLGLLVGAVIRGIIGGSDRGWAGTAGRAAVAVAVGVIVGELAALVVFSGAIDRRLDERALRAADATPAVAQASGALQQARDARSGLDAAVEQARANQDKALIVARCEYNPTPACPQTRITGVPGAGPETHTANDLLSDAQRELANALAARDRQAPELDATVAHREQAVSDARRSALATTGAGLGARWVAMNDVTLASGGALTLRLLTIAASVLVYLLPLILRRWRGETTHDRRATDRAQRERAQLDADTAIAIKRAEVRREAEMLWAEHQLTQARLAIEAQTEIDREQQRRRVTAALEAPAQATSQRAFARAADEVYLPIAAEAEAASRAITQLPSAALDADAAAPEITPNLPAPAAPRGEVEPHAQPAAPLIPSIQDATKAAARWIRPLVPPFVARVIDTTTQPLRAARQVFEEVEEITFSLRRTHRVTIDAESSEAAEPSPRRSAPVDHPASDDGYVRAHHRVSSSRGRRPSLPSTGADELSLADGGGSRELTQRDGPREIHAPEGPRQLPPGK
ncbi:DUF4407 domain-containing protein [Mycobacterium shigaense]|uniref:Membrane protein n=1 Tax=Mycobacterium shigaense TaxID=722731 RepID=A0A1Z4EID4_9MYCO|nr:DUF4407 domain-containing protein [Mycobacterium shigaense]PRI12697.1 hypothetical protein B2J96_24025 [Mycobacterium shigaense]BAX92692.1 membrane protein [Mycobacterium shigaense]